MAYPELKEKTEKRLDTSSLSLNHFLWHFVCLDIQDFSSKIIARVLWDTVFCCPLDKHSL